MSFDTLFVVLLVWTVAGLLAGIAFGKAIRQNEVDDEVATSTAASIKYLRRQRHKRDMTRTQREHAAEARGHAAKQAIG